MFASRRDQENAVHARQTTALAKSAGAKSLVPKTPAQQTTRTPFRAKHRDENAISVNKGDGKVKDAVAALEKKTSIEARRAPLGAKTANVKANAFQTPARVMTQHKTLVKATSPRLRRAKFQVHEAKEDNAEAQPEEREIEIMHPREIPLPDIPDDDIWSHDRTYPQFEGDNFTKGWALEFFDEEEEDFDTKMKKYEAQHNKPRFMKTAVLPAAAGTVSSTKAASALSGVRATASFASATSASAARSRIVVQSATKAAPAKVGIVYQRHTVAKAASNTTIGYSRGRRVSTENKSAVSKENHSDQYAPLTLLERTDVLSAMWQRTELSEDEDDEFNAPMLQDIDLSDLRDFGSIPDD